MHFLTAKIVYIIRMKRFSRKILKLISALCFCCPALLSAKEISVINWNLQTFFDANRDGCEYQEFQKSEKWNKDAYLKRLKNVCTFMNSTNSDIYVFEEIENAGIIYDISNQLAGNVWNQKKYWNYGTFYKNEGDAIGCAVISRFPINNVKIHNLDIRTEIKQPSMRPVMELSISIQNDEELVLLVNHWKSKSGGAKESEKWRNWQEGVLSNCFYRNRGKKVFAAGDFNRDINEFCIIKPEQNNTAGAVNILLRDFSHHTGEAVFSPWFCKNSGEFVFPGSYFFKENWERIDHFFSSEEIVIKDFFPVTDSLWCNEETKIPFSYRIYTGTGWSDHLPIKCILEF